MIHTQPLIWDVPKLLPRSKKDIPKVGFSICVMFLTVTGCCHKQDAEPGELLIKSSNPVLMWFLFFFFFFKMLYFKMKHTDLEILGLKKTSLLLHYLWKSPPLSWELKSLTVRIQNYQFANRTTLFSPFLSSFTNSISLVSSLCKHNTNELLTQSHRTTLTTSSTPEFTSESNSELHYCFQTFSTSCCFRFWLHLPSSPLMHHLSPFLSSSGPFPHLRICVLFTLISWNHPFPKFSHLLP